jgi:hypothetical protein
MTSERESEIVDVVGGMLAEAAMVMYMNKPNTADHEHIASPAGDTVCVHKYTNADGRVVALYVDAGHPEALILKIQVGPNELPMHTAAPTLDALGLAETLQQIRDLPEATQ